MVETFKKPFRAEPVVLGAYARKQQARSRRHRLARKFVTVGCFAVVVAGFGWLAMHSTNLLQLPVFYQNCDAARAAGVAPIRIGDPGYRKALDADDDGVACEPYADS